MVVIGVVVKKVTKCLQASGAPRSVRTRSIILPVKMRYHNIMIKLTAEERPCASLGLIFCLSC